MNKVDFVVRVLVLVFALFVEGALLAFVLADLKLWEFGLNTVISGSVIVGMLNLYCTGNGWLRVPKNYFKKG